MRNRKKKIIYADFETTSNETYKIEGETRVYLGYFRYDNGKSVKFNSIEEFFHKLPARCRVYFHNLKFDGSFILHHILKYYGNDDLSILEKGGVFYKIQYRDIEFIDSLNLLRFSLKDLAIQFNTSLPKGEIDHTKVRLIDYKPTREEEEYAETDVIILSEVIPKFYKTLKEQIDNAPINDLEIKEKIKDKVEKKLTISGIAYEIFKATCNFNSLFPKVPYDVDKAMRGAYKGGYVMCKEYVGPIVSFDINSSYPASYSEMPLPYGVPKFYKGDERHKHDLNIVEVEICYELKENCPAIIGGSIGKYGGTEYQESSNGMYEVHTFSCVDLEQIELNYDCHYRVICGFGFKKINNVFKPYCDYFYNIKNNTKGVHKLIAKLMLNSPYGKTAMNGVNYLYDYEIIDNQVMRKITGREIDEDSFEYIPLAIFITAYSRKRLYEGIRQVGYENVMYCDTDSMKILPSAVPKMDNLIDNEKIGYWKNEGQYTLAKFLAPKKYISYDCDGDKTIDVKCAGFGKDVLIREFGMFDKDLNNREYTYEEALDYINKFSVGFSAETIQFKKVEGGRCAVPVTKGFK